jgi:hypothetical protein
MISKKLLTLSIIFSFLPVVTMAAESGPIEKLKACYNAEFGSKIAPGENYEVVTKGKTKGMLVDGIPRGWAIRNENGKVYRKTYLDKFGQKDRSKACTFSYYGGDVYTYSLGSGTDFPLAFLKNGKPLNGYFEEGDVNGSYYIKVHSKNGLANGISHTRQTIVKVLSMGEDKGIYYQGFKNGRFTTKFEFMGDSSDEVFLEFEHNMGVTTNVEIKWAFPEDDNQILKLLGI